ncbi:MAG: hypothetical protein ACLSAF_02465 [Intestinimonas sp.]
MKVVLASKNQHKLVEMRDILAAQGVEVVPGVRGGRGRGSGGDGNHL